MTSGGRIVQISVSRGGVPKRAVEAAQVTAAGVEGDGHRDTEHHGGPERAVCLFAMETIEALQAEGHPIAPGALGENVTVHGIDWSSIGPGAWLRLGESLLVQVTRFTSPCTNIAGAFSHGDYARVSQKRHPGWSRVYARVLIAGAIRRGDPVRLLTDVEAQAALEARRSIEVSRGATALPGRPERRGV